MQLPKAATAASAARGGDPEAVQGEYDAARDLVEALRHARPVSVGCRRLFESAVVYADAEVAAAEWVDRLDPAAARRARARAAAAAGQLGPGGRRCRSTAAVTKPALPPLDQPQPHSVSLGRLVVHTRVPDAATHVAVVLDGRAAGEAAIVGGVASASVRARPGAHTLAVRVFAGSRRLRTERSGDVWVLPQRSRPASPALSQDARLTRRLAAVAASFDGYSAIWVHDLVTGRIASWNPDARFPAASTVKLAVLVAALRRAGARPEQSPLAYDLETLGEWSSNLASNRLLVELGGSEAGGSRVAEATLHRLGALASTFTGFYRVGTSVARARVGRQPPLVSARVTTARDLGRILFLLHAGAMGVDSALRTLGLTRHQAEMGLSVLLASRPSGDNLGLLRPNLPRGYVLAQKNGWISTARHTAGILYGTSGPKIVVVLTYRTGGLSRLDAARLAQRVLAVVPH